MEVLAIQKSALDGMKNELKALLELTENAHRNIRPFLKRNNGSIPGSVPDNEHYKARLYRAKIAKDFYRTLC